MGRIEKIRKKIKEGKLVKGFFLEMADPIVSEMAGYAGYDYVWIDAEHGPLDRQEIFHHIVAAQGAGCCAFVRVPQVDTAYMKAILDMGPDGVIFPFVNHADIARTAVEACAYPDEGGLRGQGPLRAIRYGLMQEDEYIKNAYSQVFKVMQIETTEGYDNLAEIMSVEGIDSIFIGAADLGRSLKKKGMSEGRNLQLIYDDICNKVGEKGLILGAAIGAEREEAAKAVSKGIQWVVFGQDARILAYGLRHNLEKLKDF